MLLKEIEVDSEFEDLVDHIKHLTLGIANDGDIQQILSFVSERGRTKTLIDDLKGNKFSIPPMLVTTAILAPELINFKEKRSYWVLKSDYKIVSLFNVDKEEYLSNQIFNYREDDDIINMLDGTGIYGYKTRFTRNELSEILESHNSELTIEDFMIYEGENDEN